MKMKKMIILISVFLIAGCAVSTYRTNEIDNRLELTLADLEISQPFVAEARVVKFLGIDFARLFKTEKGFYGSTSFPSSSGTWYGYSTYQSSGYRSISTNIASSVSSVVIRVIGPIIGSEASVYALYNLLNEHPEYDFILYPRVEERTKGIPILYKSTNVTVTARLGKLRQ